MPILFYAKPDMHRKERGRATTFPMKHALPRGLLQLKRTYNSSEMYGDNYGYRLGLNQSIVDHLSNKVTYRADHKIVRSAASTITGFSGRNATYGKGIRAHFDGLISILKD
jgi:hypothetical protein